MGENVDHGIKISINAQVDHAGKKLAQINSQINNMTKEEISERLQSLRINHLGTKTVVKKRLKNFYKNKYLGGKRVNNNQQGQKKNRCSSFYDYLCIVDFECTCVEGIHTDFPHEIIEFPAVLLKVSTLEVIDQFHAFCKPEIYPRLSSFCTFFTGITQEKVDAAKPFLEVLSDFRAWLESKEIGTIYPYALVCDGPWDMGKFFQMQCQHIGLPIPHELRFWINMRKFFSNFYKATHLTIPKMLAIIGLEFQGREHSGIDDARNIARIVAHLIREGCELRVNECLVNRGALDKLDSCRTPAQKMVHSINSEDVRRAKSLLTGSDHEAESSQPQQNQCLINVTSNGNSSATTSTEKNNSTKQALDSPNPLAFYLPYKVVVITRQEFLSNLYRECFTCSGSEDESDS